MKVFISILGLVFLLTFPAVGQMTESEKEKELKALFKLKDKFSSLPRAELEKQALDLTFFLSMKEKKIEQLEYKIKLLEDKNNAKIEFLIDVFKSYKNGAKINIDIILKTSGHLEDFDTFENGIKEMALQDIKDGNYNKFCVGTLFDETPGLEKMLKEKFNLNFPRVYYGYRWTPKYLETLYSIYNEEVMKALGKKFGKGFLKKAEDQYLAKEKQKNPCTRKDEKPKD